MLTGVDAIHVSTVLEDCADQLAILGKIMPGSYENRTDADEFVQEEIGQLVEGQRQLESKYESLMSKKQDLRQGDVRTKSNLQKMMDTDRDIQATGGDLKNSTHVFGRSLKQNPLTSDNITKIQEDRAFLERVVCNTLAEIEHRGTYESLVSAVREERNRKTGLQDTILKEEEGRRKLKTLQKQLVDVKKEKEVEIQHRNEMIAHLKDQLQEMKAKTNMEGKYIQKCAQVSVAQTLKRCTMAEKGMKDELESLRNKIDEETRVNAEVESFLQTHQKILSQKVEYWMEKYEKDVDDMQIKLKVLEDAEKKDLARIAELKKLYEEYEQVVVEDRIDKEKARRKAQQEEIELKNATKLQAWWRGVMVRRGLGPYSKKKKKGKKGKKSGKKKKK
ncbi:IQ domain-containing protein G-like [Lingula anatina]|uniref:Dynein regulatory complex protein 9 n=1 Tax=Lingula anatina TaxID=7574 RepID=A0A1S3HTX7_LINAN|nr:IQ domain-containing protein G-like [Lingula anatina]|eukprot:XP_013389492.1 IQ domain-containing protein G-like [Lingula anatina]